MIVLIFADVHYSFYQTFEYPNDCRDVQRRCQTQTSTGVYLIKPDGYQEPFEVFCDNGIGSGGWTVSMHNIYAYLYIYCQTHYLKWLKANSMH